MNKKSEPLFACAYSDSQRLKEAFFSPKSKKKKLHPKNKKILLISIISLVLLVSISAAIILSKYDLIIIPRQNIMLDKNSLSLLRTNSSSSVKILGHNKSILKQGAPVYLTLIPKEKTGLKIDFTKPVNLEQGLLALYLNNANLSFKIAAVAKDNRFFSNSLKPLIIEVNPVNKSNPQTLNAEEDKSLYIKVPIEFKNNPYEKTNLSRVTQVKLYFYSPQTSQPQNASTPEPMKKLSDENSNRNGIIIKDVVLVKK